MSSAAFILFASPHVWRIARIDGDATHWIDCAVGASAGEIAANVAARLREHDYAGRPVVLALASEDCLAVRVSTHGLPAGDRRALGYRLEEHLPLAAEEVVADFAPSAEGDDTLAACVRLDRTDPMVAALEAAGVAVAAIVPAATAAAQTLAAGLTEGDVVLLLDEPLSNGSWVSAVTLRARRPADWALLPADAEDVGRHLRLVARDLGLTPAVRAVGLSGALADAVSEAVGSVVPVQAGAVADAAVAYGRDLLRGRGRPWFDFRRDGLAAADRARQYRGPLNLALSAAAALLLAVTLTLLLRAAAYDRVSATSRARLAADFHAHFPDWAVPANVPAVVAAERRKALSAVATPAESAAYGSAMLTLRTVLGNLPEGGRFAFDGVSVQDTSLSLTGRLTAFEQADAIAAAARHSGMDVPPPQTRRGAGGTWAFVVQGNRPADKTAASGTDRGVASR